MANFRVEICQAQTVIEKSLIWGLSHAGLGVREQAEMPTAHRFPWILILLATTLPAKAGQRSDSGRGAPLGWCESLRSCYGCGFSATVRTTPAVARGRVNASQAFTPSLSEEGNFGAEFRHRNDLAPPRGLSIRSPSHWLKSSQALPENRVFVNHFCWT